MDQVGDAPEVGAQSGEMTPQGYVETRLAQYQEWYDRKATKMKAMHLRMRTVSVVGGALVPVLVNLDLGFARITATVLSLVVVASVSLESVYRYREQWKNYRSTEQLLGHERVYFAARVGPYHRLSERDAFTTLVARVEKAIAGENSATLNVMTLGGQVSSELQQYGLPSQREESPKGPAGQAGPAAGQAGSDDGPAVST
ncbi:DUF4231 domain-containing protein [Streptomyces sp. NPDC051079]|uniref:DUF4231 domain-containing protein n=1 Tax=Streptomyces sp. NPDC051079 TaxID=3155043 RepID=UPI003450852C